MKLCVILKRVIYLGIIIMYTVIFRANRTFVSSRVDNVSASSRKLCSFLSHECNVSLNKINQLKNYSIHNTCSRTKYIDNAFIIWLFIIFVSASILWFLPMLSFLTKIKSHYEIKTLNFANLMSDHLSNVLVKAGRSWRFLQTNYPWT